MEPCTLCPFTCGVVRPLHEGGPGHYGVCRCAMTPKAARAALHHWEEPCLSGEDPQKGGSGAAFLFWLHAALRPTVKTVKSAQKTMAGK